MRKRSKKEVGSASADTITKRNTLSIAKGDIFDVGLLVICW
jgi:hypothetical protein